MKELVVSDYVILGLSQRQSQSQGQKQVQLKLSVWEQAQTMVRVWAGYSLLCCYNGYGDVRTMRLDYGKGKCKVYVKNQKTLQYQG